MQYAFYQLLLVFYVSCSHVLWQPMHLRFRIRHSNKMSANVSCSTSMGNSIELKRIYVRHVDSVQMAVPAGSSVAWMSSLILGFTVGDTHPMSALPSESSTTKALKR